MGAPAHHLSEQAVRIARNYTEELFEELEERITALERRIGELETRERENK